MAKPQMQGDLRQLHLAKAIKVVTNNSGSRIEYVEHYKYNDTYHLKCVGKNLHGVSYRGSLLTEGKHAGHFFFQCDTDDIYEKAILSGHPAEYIYNH